MLLWLCGTHPDDLFVPSVFAPTIPSTDTGTAVQGDSLLPAGRRHWWFDLSRLPVGTWPAVIAGLSAAGMTWDTDLHTTLAPAGPIATLELFTSDRAIIRLSSTLSPGDAEGFEDVTVRLVVLPGNKKGVVVSSAYALQRDRGRIEESCEARVGRAWSLTAKTLLVVSSSLQRNGAVASGGVSSCLRALCPSCATGLGHADDHDASGWYQGSVAVGTVAVVSSLCVADAVLGVDTRHVCVGESGLDLGAARRDGAADAVVAACSCPEGVTRASVQRMLCVNCSAYWSVDDLAPGDLRSAVESWRSLNDSVAQVMTVLPDAVITARSDAWMRCVSSQGLTPVDAVASGAPASRSCHCFRRRVVIRTSPQVTVAALHAAMCLNFRVVHDNAGQWGRWYGIRCLVSLGVDLGVEELAFCVTPEKPDDAADVGLHTYAIHVVSWTAIRTASVVPASVITDREAVPSARSASDSESTLARGRLWVCAQVLLSTLESMAVSGKFDHHRVVCNDCVDADLIAARGLDGCSCDVRWISGFARTPASGAAHWRNGCESGHVLTKDAAKVALLPREYLDIVRVGTLYNSEGHRSVGNSMEKEFVVTVVYSSRQGRMTVRDMHIVVSVDADGVDDPMDAFKRQIMARFPDAERVPYASASLLVDVAGVPVEVLTLGQIVQCAVVTLRLQ